MGEWRALVAVGWCNSQSHACTMCMHFAIVYGVNSKHRKALKAVFADPVSGTMRWSDIEALFVALGCEVIEGNGSLFASI